MDADRFETLLRSLSGSPSRRNALSLLAGSALGSLLALHAAPTEGRKRKGKKKKKKRGTTPTATAPTSTGCTSNSACTTANPCRVGRCAPGDPARDANGCVFDPITGGSTTCGVGACQRTVDPRCVNGVEQTCVPGAPDCSRKKCGDDGCGGSCGSCIGDETCGEWMCCPPGYHNSCYDDAGIWICRCCKCYSIEYCECLE